MTQWVTIRNAERLKGLVKCGQPERTDYTTGGLVCFRHPHIILTPEMLELGGIKAVIVDAIEIQTLFYRNKKGQSLVAMKLFRLAKETLLSYKDLPGWWPAEWFIV